MLPADSHRVFRIACAMRQLLMPRPDARPVSAQIQQTNSNWPRQKTHHDRWQKSTSMLIAAAKTPPMSLKLVPFGWRTAAGCADWLLSAGRWDEWHVVLQQVPSPEWYRQEGPRL